MEHHHHHIDDESNEIVSTIVSEIVDDEESHLKVVKQYQITDHGDDYDEDEHCNHDGKMVMDVSDQSKAVIIDTQVRKICTILDNEVKRRMMSWKGGMASNYRQKYKKHWESIPELKDWVLPLAGDPYSAFCRFCHCQLHAHKKGLLSHAKSTKHKKSLLQPIHPDQTNGSSKHSFGSASSPTSYAFAAQNLTKRPTFNDNWLTEPFFKPWLRKVPSNNTKALCIACRSILSAGRSELVKHTLVAKHQKAIREGFDEHIADIDLEWLDPNFNPANFSQVVMALPSSHTGGSGSNVSNEPEVQESGLPLNEVVDHLNDLSPLHLAERWDNVGLLVKPSKQLFVNSILITNDLTEKVMEEAIKKKVNLIISYHPPIFKPLKRLDLSSWKESIIVSCIESRIALYSPHTALDAIKGGINDWLVESFGELVDVKPITQSSCDPRNESHFSNCLDMVSGSEVTSQLSNIENIVLTVKNTEYHSGGVDVRVCCNDDTLPKVYEVVTQHPMAQICSRLSKLVPPPLPGVGMGRLGKLKSKISIQDVIDKVKIRTGIKHVRLALGSNCSLESKISSIAVCAGSGYSLVSQVKADVLVTGEMSHHEVLDCIHKGSTVILTEHSNSERGYLNTIYATNLKSVLGPSINVILSTTDSDPLKIA